MICAYVEACKNRWPRECAAVMFPVRDPVERTLSHYAAAEIQIRLKLNQKHVAAR